MKNLREYAQQIFELRFFDVEKVESVLKEVVEEARSETFNEIDSTMPENKDYKLDIGWRLDKIESAFGSLPPDWKAAIIKHMENMTASALEEAANVAETWTPPHWDARNTESRKQCGDAIRALMGGEK